MATGVLALHEYTRSIDIRLLSFNMHGFYQGLPVLEDLINTENPVIILLQEHWLTPDNLIKFQQHFVDYFPYGSSAMLGCLQSGMLRGRPFGGVMTLVRKDMRGFTQTIHCDDRFVIIRFANYLIANVYLPCCGTKDRESLCSSILDDVNSWREQYLDCKFILAGDLNVNLDICDTVSARINKFAHSCCLHRCDVLFPGKKASTYVNVALGHENCIDYILTSCPEDIVDFDVLDPDVNFSDHLPLSVKIHNISAGNKPRKAGFIQNDILTKHFRWDKADLTAFYALTGALLSPVLHKLDLLLNDYVKGALDVDACSVYIDNVYDEIVATLKSAAVAYVPKYKPNFFKFW